MSKRTFVLFGLVVLVLAVVIPWLAFRADGEADRTTEKVSSDLASGQTLFQINCGACHTLASAGTDGNFGPDLDELLAASGTPTGPKAGKTIEGTKGRVLNAIDEGVDSSTTPGRMPGKIISGEQAEEVAEFVAQTAGRG